MNNNFEFAEKLKFCLEILSARACRSFGYCQHSLQLSLNGKAVQNFASCKLWGTVSTQVVCVLNLLHARTASFTSFQLWQLGVLAIRTYVRPQIRYPTHDNNPLFTPTHLRSCLKSGLPAECEVSLRSKACRHVSCRQISKVRKIVMRERELRSNSFPHFSTFSAHSISKQM